MPNKDKTKEKEYQKRYRAEHVEEIREYQTEYSSAHREELKEYKAKYRAEHAEELKEKYARRYAKERDKVLKRSREYRATHQEELRERGKQPGRKYSNYKSGAKKRDIEWSLTKEEFVSFWQKPCTYCKEPIETIGLDRIDNSLGYEIANVVPCCAICNKMKLEMSQKKFFDRCHNILTNHSGSLAS